MVARAAAPGVPLACSVAPAPREQPAAVPGERHGSCGFSQKKWVFPKKSCFQVTWNQPGCCVPPRWDGTVATLVLHWASPPSGASGHPEVPRGTGHVPRGYGKTQAHRPGIGHGDRPPSSTLPQAPAWVWGPPQAPACRTPDPLLPFTASPLQLQPCSLPGALDMADRQCGKGFPRERVCFMPGRCTYPTCSVQSQSISSPLPKKRNRSGRSEQPPTSPRRCAPSLLRHQPLQNVAAEAESHKIKYGRRVCGANKSWGGLGVRVPTPPARGCGSPQGQQSLPKRSFGASCAAVALPYQHGCSQYTHRSGNFISYTGMEWFWGWP